MQTERWDILLYDTFVNSNGNLITSLQGSIRIGVDATDIFDRYEDEFTEYRY